MVLNIIINVFARLIPLFIMRSINRGNLPLCDSGLFNHTMEGCFKYYRVYFSKEILSPVRTDSSAGKDICFILMQEGIRE